MKNTKFYDFTLTAGGSFNLNVAGSFFRIISCTGVIEVQADAGTLGPLNSGQGFRNAPYTRLTLVDKSGSPNKGVVIVADSDFVDDRISGEVSVIDGGKSRTVAGSTFMSGFYSAAVAGQLSYVGCFNAAGSGRNVFVEQVQTSLLTAGNGIYFRRLNAVTGVLVNAMKAKNQAAADSAVSSLYNGANAALLGTSLTFQHVTAGLPNILKFSEPVMLPPGYGLYAQGGAVNVELAAVFECYEEAA